VAGNTDTFAGNLRCIPGTPLFTGRTATIQQCGQRKRTQQHETQLLDTHVLFLLVFDYQIVLVRAGQMTLQAHLRICFVLNIPTLESFRMRALGCSICIYLSAG
jgi:hypothetical protein